MAKKKSKKRTLRNKKGQFVKRSKAKKTRRARNPERVRYAKKPKKPGMMKGFRTYYVPSDISYGKESLERLAARVNELTGKPGMRKKQIRKAIAKRSKAEKLLKRFEALVASDGVRRKQAQDRGYTEASVKYFKPKGLSPKRSNPVAKKKKSSKKKHAKKKVRYMSGKSKLSALLKAATPKHPVRGKYKRKGRVAKVRVSRSAYRRAKNPIFGGSMIQSYLAHSAGEAGGLLVGGALYGLAGSLIGRIPVIGPKVVDTLRKVPVVGPSLPTLLAGVVLVKLGERQRIDALRMVGKGLIGATVVGIGVQVSQKIPGLAPAGAAKLAGVDYTALDGVDFTSMGSDVDAADFGGDGQLGEIAYGELPEGLSGVDFTMGDGADFGELPEGLGEGQMG